ncbi:MAG: glycosyltransferase family 2 protein [Bryobacteraceae bacterium]|nr:glycosyltransferase family 2 protein [Bryobacteraceae bacterium]
MTTGAVIVTWNSAAHIGDCLDALRLHEPSVPVAVVDNASTDNTLHQVRLRPDVLLAANPENRGFAAAVNQGVTLLPECDLILVLNPDAILQSGLHPLRAEFASPHTAVCGGRLLDASGQPQSGFEMRRFPTPAALAFETLGINRLWPSNPVNRRYRCLDADTSAPCDAQQPAGAFLMIRRLAWSEIGGFDEHFHPVWFEDVDFLYRLASSGWTIRFSPLARALHAGGHSVSRMRPNDRELAWYGSLLRYVVRHFSGAGKAAVCWAVFASAVPRAAVRAVRGISFHPFSVCTEVMRLSLAAALSGLLAGREGTSRERALPSPVHECAKLVNSGDRSPH